MRRRGSSSRARATRSCGGARRKALRAAATQETGAIGITEAFETARLYSGAVSRQRARLLIGYNAGYRTSWDCATGVVSGPVFEDNLKAWSGDHCIDPRQVPGVLFCNRPIDATDPALIDIAPTALHLFGVEPPAYMEGKVLMASRFAGEREAATA